jgi:hypothetical protein
MGAARTGVIVCWVLILSRTANQATKSMLEGGLTFLVGLVLFAFSCLVFSDWGHHG